MNKTLSTVLIIWMLLSITENVISIERTKEYQERQEFLDSRYEKLNSRLEVYEELVSPKNTQFYVDELERVFADSDSVWLDWDKHTTKKHARFTVFNNYNTPHCDKLISEGLCIGKCWRMK